MCEKPSGTVISAVCSDWIGCRMDALHTGRGCFALMDMIFGFNVYDQPTEQCYAYALEHGMRHLEIDLIKDHSALHSFTPKRTEAIRIFCEEKKIDLSLHVPYTLNLADRISYQRKSNIAYFKKSLAVGAQLRARHVTCHVGQFSGFVSWPWLRRQMLDRVVASLSEIVVCCEEWGIPLALENAVSLVQGAEQHFLGDSVADFLYIYNQLPSPWLRFCLDIGHANTNDGAVAFMEALAEKLVCVHFHDNQGRFDDHQDIGHGTVPWAEVAKGLHQLRYRGPFISECFRSAPHSAAALFRDLMRGVGG
jgi:sugar phosphate isomerase/epimerase